MNKNVTYNLDETRLRGLLEQYQAGFDEQQWLDTEKNLDALGLQRKANVQMSIRKLAVFAGLVVLGGGLVAFISYNTKSKRENLNSSFAKNNSGMEVNKPEEEITVVSETNGIKVSNEIPKLVLNRKGIEIPVASENPKKTEETLIAEKVTVNEKKEEVKESISTVPDSKKSENSSVQNADAVKKDEVVTDNNNDTKKKKKKKKKKHHNEDNGTTVTPSAGEDDVIISE